MSTTKAKLAALDAEMPPSTDPEYLAWKEAKIKAAMKKKQDGTATYTSIDEIAAKFGFDAR
ncbi:hypothetical protein [uncultured Marivita sp.]|uniref:hypothetical protein n=1 Tax=uncultured Marivita sp. TaxID=888080 RepID=UPI002635ABDD|nr:hypothetical protein [uncultured Marivita sp.]